MNKEMIKAPLDETNVSPTTIIDELTNCDNIQKDNTAVGYIDNAPVLFEYSKNIMRITFRNESDFMKHVFDILKYRTHMEENTEHLKVKYSYDCIIFELRFYWDTKNK